MKKKLLITLLSVLMLVACAIGFAACGQVEFKLSFIVDGEVYASIDTSGDEVITMPDDPEKEDYIFDGWYWDEDTWQRPFTANSLLNEPISSDMSVYAKWLEEDITKRSYTVSFNSFGGSAVSDVTVQYGKLLTEPSEPARTGYVFVGWYKDADLKTEWDFAFDTVTEDITLYAKWLEIETINIHYGENNAQLLTLEVRRDGTEDWNVFNSFREPSWADHTFFGFYYDEEYTQPVTFPYTYTEENPDVYARFLEGEWLLVSSPAEFAKIRYNTNVWLMNDIDMSEAEFSQVSGVYQGEFNGNGYTVSGIAMERETTRSAYAVGMFTTIGPNAYFHDVTFENITLSVEFTENNNGSSPTNYVGLLAATWEEGARFENVSVSGSVSYDSSTTGRTVECGGVYGRYTGETFEYPGFTADVNISDANAEA